MAQLSNALSRGLVRSLSLPRSEQSELLDAAKHDPIELADNLRDIRRVNRLLGGTSTVLRHLPRLVELAQAPGQPVTVLDLATGSADIPFAVARWARANDVALTIVASDFSEEVLALAERDIASHPDVWLARYDARAVPLPDKSFDIVLCSLSLHHFAPTDATRVLREMNRLARTGFIINDLRRGRVGFAAAWIAARLTTRNRLTRHDAPLSVLRAYTPAELATLLQQAAIDDAVITTHPWFRMAAVKVSATPDG